MNYAHWLASLVQTIMARQASVKKEAAQPDLTLPVLQGLLNQGYQFVTWHSSGSTCAKCLELNEQKWNLDDFVSGLTHDAPMAERSHPNDRSCTLLVEGDGMDPVAVDYNGNVTPLQ